jgi:chromosome segregation protein
VFTLYLKRLEVKGFKSFADKVELDFGKGITAVVGPNGSGKSNISDAIRWVLGEQSAKTLRGSRMEDIIFAGTENRKSLGLAEVSLTIDNSDNLFPLDYSEITVTRRLYRSGESEYLINNTTCRLKDIVELFMDTGIGKDGYSLIGQGKIDEILSARSEDRRNLFEEAAGIVKYKTRKQDAEKKLENTKQNLIRVNDIIQELDEQIEPLSEQSQVARKYLTLREELKELEINVILNNYEASKKKLDKISFDINELNLSRNDNENKKQEMMINFQNLRNNLKDIEKEHEEINNVRLELEKNFENKQGALKLLNERHDNLMREQERLKSEIKDEEKLIENIDNDHMGASYKKELISEGLKDKKILIDEVNRDYLQINQKCLEFDSLVDSKKSDLIQKLKEESDINNKISTSQTNIQNLESRKKQLDNELQVKNFKKSEIRVEINKIEDVLENYNGQAEVARRKQHDMHSSMKSLEEANINLKKERNIIYDKLKSSEARFRTLNDLDKDMEGFSRAVKSVISSYKDYNRVYGTISDLIEVPKGFEVAMEIALAAAIQNIVVDNENTAAWMINYLKSNNLGRATFLPLTTIKGREIKLNNDITKLNGYIGIASDVLQYDSKFKNIISNLLGRVLICDNLESAKAIAKKSDYSYRIVTLEGDVINSGGSFTGGSTNLKNSGVFSRKSEIKDLEDLIKTNKLLLENKEYKITNNEQEVIILKNNLDIIDEEIQKLFLDINTKQSNIASFNREYDGFEEGIKGIEVELTHLQNELNKNTSIVEINKTYLDELVNNQQIIEKEINDLQVEYKNYQVKKEETLNNLTQEKILFAEQNKMLESVDAKLLQLQRDKENHKLKIVRYFEEVSKSDISIEETRNETKSIIAELQGISENVINIKNKIFNIDKDKKEISGSIAVIEKDLSNYEENLSGIIQSIHKLEISKSRIETETENLSNKLWDEYELSIPQAGKYRKDIYSVLEASKKVNELKNNIKSLGNVNVNAIEEYKRVTERHEFLTRQKDDLIKAEQSLLDIITEITKRMEQQFEEKFKLIKENFNQTFRELFEGGYGDLKLEGNDVLNSGIEIIVQPPGKKLQSLSLLSGGERGLAAIALVFAILKMKPTPFCVLDEIEAALDDANVNRFADFLRAYSKNTQFITVTHRKGSMAAADALYGVTMEEKGISKIVSIKFKGGN